MYSKDKDTIQGHSQDLETGCPKLAIEKFLGIQILKRDHNILGFQPYKFIKIRHDILIQCHWIHMEMEKFKYMLEIDILRNSSQKNWGVLRVWVSKNIPAG